MTRLRALLSVAVVAGLLIGPARASELSQVAQKANHLIALNRLGLTTQQIDRILPLCGRLVQAVQARNTERQKLIGDASQSLAAARTALVAGDPLPDAAQAALEGLEKSLQANDDKLAKAAVEALADIEKEFLPQQNAYIDWTPPHAAARPSRQSQAEAMQKQREGTALILAIEQQLERIRTYPLERYILEAQKVVDDFLRPLVDPDSPDYPAAQHFMLKVVEQVRLMGEPEWQDRREEMAVTLVRGLGLLGEPQQAKPEERPYNWEDMYAIFSDLGAPDLLQAMKKARTTQP